MSSMNVKLLTVAQIY